MSTPVPLTSHAPTVARRTPSGVRGTVDDRVLFRTECPTGKGGKRRKKNATETSSASSARIPLHARRAARARFPPRPAVIRPRSPHRRQVQDGQMAAAALILVHVLIAAHIVQWWVTGMTISPSSPLNPCRRCEGVVNAGFVFFALAIGSTLILGRFFCGWACHIVALQDLCSWMMGKISVKPKPFRSRLLVFVPLILALYMFVWPVVHREVLRPLFADARGRLPVWLGQSEPLSGLTSEFLVDDFWATFALGRSPSRSYLCARSARSTSSAPRASAPTVVPMAASSARRSRSPRQDPRHRRLRTLRPLHRRLHLKRPRPRRGPRLRHGRRSRVHEVPRLHQRLPQRRALLRSRQAHDPRDRSRRGRGTAAKAKSMRPHATTSRGPRRSSSVSSSACSSSASAACSTSSPCSWPSASPESAASPRGRPGACSSSPTPACRACSSSSRDVSVRSVLRVHSRYDRSCSPLRAGAAGSARICGRRR